MTGRACGTVLATRGAFIEARLPLARVGDGVRIAARTPLAARVVALRGTSVVLAPFGELDGVACGDAVACDPAAAMLPLGTPLLGRAIDAAGAPLDDGPRPRGRLRTVAELAHSPAQRRRCTEMFWTGVRAIDGPLALARGARVGIFGAPGAGKSSLLDAIVRGADADVVVVALIGERGREAQRRLEAVGARTTLVCATAERPASERVRAAEVAFAQAEALRARGLDVLLVVDSLARVCAAARELALASGEPAGRGGYPPGVFALLARLLERGGRFAYGSITLIGTVLADAPEADDPVGTAARAALDGHLVLTDRLARAGRYPAIDVAASASRTMADAAGAEQLAAARTLRAAVALLEESREARALGVDPTAGDPALARAVAAEDAIERFLRQGPLPTPPSETLTELAALADRL